MLLADLSVGKEVFYFEILKCSIFIILWDRGGAAEAARIGACRRRIVCFAKGLALRAG